MQPQRRTQWLPGPDVLIRLGVLSTSLLGKNIYLAWGQDYPSPSTTEAMSEDLSPRLKEVVTALQPD